MIAAFLAGAGRVLADYQTGSHENPWWAKGLLGLIFIFVIVAVGVWAYWMLAKHTRHEDDTTPPRNPRDPVVPESDR